MILAEIHGTHLVRLFHGLKSLADIPSIMKRGLLPGGSEEAVCLAPTIEGAYDYRDYHKEHTYGVVEVLARQQDCHSFISGEDEVEIRQTIGFTGLPRIVAVYIIGVDDTVPTKEIIEVVYSRGGSYDVGYRLKTPTHDESLLDFATNAYRHLPGGLFYGTRLYQIDGGVLTVRSGNGYTATGPVLDTYPASLDGFVAALRAHHAER